MNTLTQVPVQFLENRAEGLHKYLLGLVELTGVTTILKEVIFRDKYSGIDPAVLRNAADRGTAIHEAVQAYMTDDLGWELSADLKDYEADALKAGFSWQSDPGRAARRAVAVEYLVSDCKAVATKIDVVEADGKGGYILGDIKTTSMLDMEYLSWQLSVEKWLFENQNPGAKVTALRAIWYNRSRNEWKEVDVYDRGAADVERLLAAWQAGEFWGMPMPTDAEVPAPVMSLAEYYADMEARIKELTARRDEFRDRLLQLMQEHGIEKVKADGFTCSLVAASERRSIDTKRMQAEHPELSAMFSQYEKTVQVKQSIKITLK